MSDNINKVLKYFYTVCFKNGKVLTLKLSDKKIKHLNKVYKENFESYTNFADFESSFTTDFEDFKKSKSAYKEIEKQFASHKGLQSSILTECFVAQALADAMGLDLFEDIDDELSNIPIKLANNMRRGITYNDGASFRYVYYDDHYDTFVLQCGGSSTVDIVFNKFNASIRIEIKEKVSKLAEDDLSGLYGENGKLIEGEEFKKKYPEFLVFINLFNAHTDMFACAGHNFKIEDHISKDKLEKIIEATLNDKVIDIYLFVVDGDIIPILSKNLLDFISIEGSEIRTAGRNSKALFTPNYAKKVIYSLGGTINCDIVSIPKSKLTAASPRGKKEITRYKLSSLIFIRKEHITENEGNFIFKFSKIEQLKPSISVHLNAVKNNDTLLLEQFFELQSNV